MEKDFRLEDENIVQIDQKGPDLMNEEIYAATSDIKMEKPRVLMIYRQSF